MKVAGRALQVVKLVVLARLLTPADFGLLGIAMLTLAVLEQFSKLGIDAALIQRKEEDVDEFLNTAWSMQIVRGVAISSVLFLAAPYVAEFFGEPRTVDIVRAIAVLPVIIGFKNPGIVYLEKNLEFHRRFLYALSGPVANVTVSITLALLWRNVWALVFGSVVGTVVTLLISYYVHEYRPWPKFDRGKARDLYGYGKWITASAIATFLISQGDDAFVGWFLTAAALGFYQMAYRLSNAPATEIASVVSEVVFPAYSRVQSDVARLRKAYYLSLQFVAILSFPMVAGIVVVAPVFTRAFLGEQWLPMVPAMQIIAVWGGLRALANTMRPVFKAVGRPDYNTWIQVLQLGVIAGTVFPATDAMGIAGTALSVVASALVAVPILVALTLQQVDGDVRELLRILAYPTVGSGLMGASVYYSRVTLAPGLLLEFVALVLVGVGVYVGLMLGFERQFDYGIEPLLRRIVSAVR